LLKYLDNISDNILQIFNNFFQCFRFNNRQQRILNLEIAAIDGSTAEEPVLPHPTSLNLRRMIELGKFRENYNKC